MPGKSPHCKGRGYRSMAVLRRYHYLYNIYLAPAAPQWRSFTSMVPDANARTPQPGAL